MALPCTHFPIHALCHLPVHAFATYTLQCATLLPHPSPWFCSPTHSTFHCPHHTLPFTWVAFPPHCYCHPTMTTTVHHCRSTSLTPVPISPLATYPHILLQSQLPSLPFSFYTCSATPTSSRALHSPHCVARLFPHHLLSPPPSACAFTQVHCLHTYLCTYLEPFLSTASHTHLFAPPHFSHCPPPVSTHEALRLGQHGTPPAAYAAPLSP